MCIMPLGVRELGSASWSWLQRFPKLGSVFLIRDQKTHSGILGTASWALEC